MTSTVQEPVHATGTTTDTITDWYRDAVIYQVHVRSFCDSDGDGIGDFVGLTRKLDYIESLGVTAIWLQPFYPSPLKDDGYDIADFLSIHPNYGTLDDFQHFLDEAHARGLRVITELVINHTSDQHPWFQRARRAAPGDPDRNFYVWSDNPKQYANTRIIFHEIEPSNWSFDPVAQSYFWHRFYSHQPDLNFDYEPVHNAVLEVVDFWMRRGVDGMRLDAIPYLYEREGTTCESLPETHAFLKKLRRHVDQSFPGRMLLAEANQWTEDAAAYFGDGDECHMSFHFPLMPRLFMAVQQESRFPVADILDQTPTIPSGCQWAIFLRSHDELTLEMVSEEERDYMFRQFADDPQARVHWGIRRRLAPLVRNSRRKLELLYGLLFSLPGTPIVYYGDELRMGDNIYLRDRDAVRTPMQWSADRNAGFSSANPQRLFLPVIVDPAFHYTTRNVENDLASPSSFLWWMRRVIQIRNRHPAFGRGTLRLIRGNNPHVVGFVREHESESILVVANFSRYAQGVDLDLSPWVGHQPEELFGMSRFPVISESRYFLSLGPQSFYWLRLKSLEVIAHTSSEPWVTRIRTKEPWPVGLGNAVWDDVREAIPAFLAQQPWFQDRSRPIRHVEWRDVLPLTDRAGVKHPWLLLCQVDFLEGESQEYVLLLQWSEESTATEARDRSSAVVTEVLWPDGKIRTLTDVGADEATWASLFERFRTGVAIRSAVGEIFPAGSGTRLAATPIVVHDVTLERKPEADHHESANWRAAYHLKLYRRIEPGIHPEIELGDTLSQLGDDHAIVPRLMGWLEYRRMRQPARVLAALSRYVPHELTAWDWFFDDLRRIGEVWSCGPAERADNENVSSQETSARIEVIAARSLNLLEQIGRRVAELHSTFCRRDLGPSFTPEPFTPHYQRSIYQSMRIQLLGVFELLESSSSLTTREISEAVNSVLARREEFLDCFESLLGRSIDAHRIRCHGDMRLQSILLNGDHLAFVGLEGNARKPLTERRIRRCGMRDVASLATSIADVANHVCESLGLPAASSSRLSLEQAALQNCFQQWGQHGIEWVLRGYHATAEASLHCPASLEETRKLLAVYQLDHLLSLIAQRHAETKSFPLSLLHQLIAFRNPFM